jgi:Coenzyme PQQ synthesis protein D (PqqD)
MTITLDSTISRNPDMLFTAVNSENGYMLNIEKDHYFSLDDIGVRIWQILDQPQTIYEVAAQLATEFSVDKERVQNSVLTFAKQLVAHQVIHIAPA